MQIKFSEKTRSFKLDTAGATYLMQIGPSGELRHLYYGAAISDDDAVLELGTRHGKASFSSHPEGLGAEDSLDLVPLEFSTFGSGDQRMTAAALRKVSGTSVTSSVYRSHSIFQGKKPLPGLPASFAPDTEVQTLEITMADGFSGADFVLSYSIFEDSDVIARSIRVENTTDAPLVVERLMSAQIDFHSSEYDLIYLQGRWARERQAVRRPLAPGRQGFRSSRGSTGHQYNPGFVLASPSATESVGDAYGMLLMYSGNYTADIETDQYGTARAMIGINPENFSWTLAPGEQFQTPEALVLFSPDGLGGLSRQSHRFLMEHVIRSPWKHVKRPILVNNWEATYFDFDDRKIYEIAKTAATLGIEMLVLDDGWFGKRDDDHSSLGDWFVNRDKIGDLGELVRRINDLHMKFGLWFEPEMISEKSNLYQQHPDWVLTIPGFRKSIGRDQMVLDMSRPEVVDYLFETIAGILHSANIEYIKWDMNRNLTEIHSAVLPAERQKEVAHRYVLGVYALHERLLKEFPNLLIEGCSGGGGRFDAGMLYYAPQIWCSDDTDALERVSIQLGTSLFYPSASMGAHVSVCPNHQTGRTVSFETRGTVALAGTFGYELDLTRLSDEDRELVKRQVKEYHRYNDLIREGSFHRLTEGFGTGTLSVWSWVSQDRKRVLVTAVRKTGVPCGHDCVRRIRLRGLDPRACYVFSDTGTALHGDTLMNAGFTLDGLTRDASSRLYYLEVR